MLEFPLTRFVQAESITEGTLKQWSKQVGDFVKQDEEIATIETDKASDVSRSVPSRIFPPFVIRTTLEAAPR